MWRRKWKLSLSLVVIIALLAGAAGLVAVSSPLAFNDFKRTVRISLGLPKNWETNFNEAVANRSSVQCPGNEAIVIVTGGQSNAANAIGDKLGEVSREALDARSFMFFDGQCYQLADPVLGATGLNESLWPELGRKMVAAFDRPVVFINGAVHGSQVSDWLDQRSSYSTRLVKNITDAAKIGLTADFVFWIQGETDAALRVDPTQFGKDLLALIHLIEIEAQLKSNPPHWLLFLSTKCLDRPNNGPALEQQILQLAADRDDNIYTGPSLTDLPQTARRDGCHLNSDGRDKVTDRTIMALRDQHASIVGQ